MNEVRKLILKNLEGRVEHIAVMFTLGTVSMADGMKEIDALVDEGLLDVKRGDRSGPFKNVYLYKLSWKYRRNNGLDFCVT